MKLQSSICKFINKEFNKVAFFWITQIGGPNYEPQIWDIVKRFFACDRKSPGARAQTSFRRDRWPEVPEKPEVNQKAVITARWRDIFAFLNTPYLDGNCWFYTKYGALNLILKSNFDLEQQKMKKLTFSFTAYHF